MRRLTLNEERLLTALLQLRDKIWERIATARVEDKRLAVRYYLVIAEINDLENR